jgi:hypothetical protein
MNRKGIFGMSLPELIGLTLGLVIIGLVIAPFMGRALAGFLGEGQDEAGAKANLAALSGQINNLLADPQPFAARGSFQYGLRADKFILIAFNHGEESVKQSCTTETAKRPAECPTGTCLCLYKDTTGIDFNEKPLLCQPFARNIVMLGPGNKEEECVVHTNGVIEPCIANTYTGSAIRAVDAYEPPPTMPARYQGTREIADLYRGWNMGVPIPPPGHRLLESQDYESFALYGECGSTTWNVQPMYLEKFLDDDKIYVYLARQSALTQKRFDTLSKELLKTGIP